MNRSGEHAVVLGAGMAGLLAARVLSESYRTVTIVERDELPDKPTQRKGIPQGRHLHSFLSRGPQILGELFPGLLDELVEAGAVRMGDPRDGGPAGVHVRIGPYELARDGRPADPASLTLYQASRPFFEFHVRRRVMALDDVTILDGHEAVAFVAEDGTVTGVRIAKRGDELATALAADLVVDATGRAARSSAMLAALGFDAPAEHRAAGVVGYSSHLVHVPNGYMRDEMVFVNQGPDAPGALLVAYEHDTWMLAITCPTELGTPPTSFDAALAAADAILPAAAATGLHEATPLAEAVVARTTNAVWRRYDQMATPPRGLIVMGDALCSLNPIYGQGMTVAAQQVLALRDCLRDGPAGLPRRFYAAASQLIGPVWAFNRANDRSTSDRVRTRRQRLLAASTRAVLRAATVDVGVTERLLRVRNLVDPPARLRQPTFLARVAWVNLRLTVAGRAVPAVEWRSRRPRVGIRPSRRPLLP